MLEDTLGYVSKNALNPKYWTALLLEYYFFLNLNVQFCIVEQSPMPAFWPIDTT